MRHGVSSLGTTESFFLAPGYAFVPRTEWLRRNRDTLLPKGVHIWYKSDDGLWWLENQCEYDEDGVYLVRVWDDQGPIKLPLFPARYTTSTRAVRSCWCLQVHVAGTFSREVQRNVDDSRGAAVIS